MHCRNHLFLTLCIVFAFFGCGKTGQDNSPEHQKPVVIAIEGDIDSFNPLFAEDVTAGEINDLFFPGLVGSSFDTARGMLTYTPSLANTWEFKNDHKDLVFHLKTGARWSDGHAITAHDVRASYELYGDPELGSVRQNSVQNLSTWQGKPDIARSVEVVNDSTVMFHFAQASPSQLFDAGLPVLPSHVLDTIPRKDIRAHAFNRAPIVSGPFMLKRWTPLEGVVLASNPLSTIPFPAKLPQLIFRVLPDYRTRVSQLQSGEVDIVGGLRSEDAALLARSAESVRLVFTPGRDYDFLGWNNIDQTVYNATGGKSIKPHPLFGSARVRRALTMAIDREQIVRAYLGGHGRVAVGGISPIFRWAYNDTLKPLPFDKTAALALLEKEGWRDSDGDGILDNKGVKFSFSLKMPAGNQLRVAVATVVQQQLRDIKIAMSIDQVERGTFWENLIARKYDACFAGFSVPLQMQLDDLWGSDLEKFPFNVTGFRNARVDEILAACRLMGNEVDGAHLWKEFQEIINDQQPCTFLYWIDSITGVNTRIEGMSAGILATTQEAWEWHLHQDKRVSSAE